MSRRRRALLSVSDKHGLVAFARRLAALSFELVSTGGTARALREAGLAITDVASVTGFPEIMDGRVKTLHPAVHAGLLARRGVDDAVLSEHALQRFDLLAVNLYPFEQATAAPDCSVADAIENIDVGGPAMLRAAAKNHDNLTVVVDPADYDAVADAFAGAAAPAAAVRRRLAIKAFRHTAAYDTAISGWLDAHAGDEPELFPETLTRAWRRAATLRYGENPHQQAALYVERGATGGGVAHATQRQGKALSFNNLVDADAAWQCVASFADSACVIVKHANPCGVAVAATPATAYDAAYRCDPTSAFGGIIAFNREVDAATARAIVERQFAEVVVAPAVAADALDAFASKANIRVLECGAGEPAAALELKTIGGGLLCQQRDTGAVERAALRTVTRRAPTDTELDDLLFAWRVVKYVKSNAIVYASGGRTLGIGAGQMSRVVSARIAALKAEEEGIDIAGGVLASDAFFPFADGVETAAERGIRAIIQPGGSMRDDEVIAAADAHDVAMVFTAMRHFRH